VGIKISGTPPANTFPTTSVDLTFPIAKIGDNKDAEVKISFPKGMEPMLDPTKTGFTKGGTLVQSETVSMAPTIMNLGGNQYEVVLTNVNSQPVDVTAVTIMYNDPGNPNSLDTYTPGGTLLSITQPTNPIGVGQTLEYFFQANPNLTVSVSDTVALDSSPGDQYFDLAPSPLPSTLRLKRAFSPRPVPKEWLCRTIFKASWSGTHSL
jgi:hypothetical protein